MANQNPSIWQRVVSGKGTIFIELSFERMGAELYNDQMNYLGINGRPNGVCRAELTSAQQQQAEKSGLLTAEHRATRVIQPTHAIDNKEPQVPSDRDDGIYVEPKEDGGWTVHVTIADVAGHISPGSELAKAAHQRGETLYQVARGVHDPMFGPVMEGRMSLEHRRDRLGLDVIIELDKDFRPAHTSFKRVIAKPDNAIYAQAAERMKSEPSFQRMKLVGDAIRENVFGNAESEELEAQIGGDVYNSLNASEQEVFKMIETFMILANREVGRFAHQTRLPIMYRNFDGSVKFNDNERAYYETEWTQHKDLAKRNIDYYCHFTSPIRRGPDFFNGHQIHYAIDVAEALSRHLPEKTETELWEMLPRMLPPLVQYRQGEIKIAELKTALTDVLGMECTEMISELSRIQLPYTERQLSLYAKNINDLAFQVARTRRQSRSRLDRERFSDVQLGEDLKQIKATPNGSGSALAAIDRDKLSSMIDKACMLEKGQLDKDLAAEVLRRLRHIQSSGSRSQMNLAQDAFNVLIKAQFPYDPRWRVLKKEMAKTIKHDAVIVNTVYDMVAKEEARQWNGSSEKSPLALINASLPLDEYFSGWHEDSYLHAALVVESGEPDVAAPYYSVGHDNRAAESHAKWSYIEHKAFSQLLAFDASRLPNLLYAELEQDDKTREEVVREMVAGLGASIAIESFHQVNGQYKAIVTISGGVFSEPLSIEAETDGEIVDADEEVAVDLAIKRLLRHSEFKQQVGTRAPLARHRDAHPRKELESVIKRLSSNNPLWHMNIDCQDHKKQGPEMHYAEVRIHPPSGRVEYYAGYGNNRDKAVNEACVKALKEMGRLNRENDPAVSSWVGDVAHRRSHRNGNGLEKM